jgi:hypothetical protein
MKCRVDVSVGWMALIVLAGMVIAASAPSFAPGAAATSAPASEVKAAGPTVVAPSEKAGEPQSTTPADQKARKASGAKKAASRLPTYYTKVIDKEQRAKILAIQDEYAAKIEAIQRQLKDLTKERDDKIAAVLTPEQQKKIDELKAAAQKARDDKKAVKEKPAK